jgi:HKD family nuclease
MMRFISNNHSNNHIQAILKCIADSDEIWIAVAFLKKDGFNLIKNSLEVRLKQGVDVYLVAGRYFGISNPYALDDALELLDGKGNSMLYLANYDPNFHPKLFVFRKGSNYTIISGSANLTNGGMTNNVECSLLVEANENDQVCKDAREFMEGLMKYGAVPATEELIEEYRQEWIKQQEATKDARPKPGVKKGKEEKETARSYFKLTLGKENSIAQDCWVNSYLGIGYKIEEDLTQALQLSKSKFYGKYKDKIRELYKEVKEGIISYPKKQLITRRCNLFWDLFHAKVGDIVLSPLDSENFILGKVTNKGNKDIDNNRKFIANNDKDLLYYFQEGERYPHRMKVEWFGKIPKEMLSEELRKSIKNNTFLNLNECYQEEMEALVKMEKNNNL